MTGLQIKSRGTGEAPGFPEFGGDEVKGLKLIGAEIVQGLTGRGRTGVILLFEDAEGNKYYSNTTARLIANGLAAAIKGTSERFSDDLNQA